MCDTFVALADATADGSVLLAKNSDREPNEAHEVVFAPAASPADKLRCTYITVPQAARTHAVLLGKPYWIWGAEMGANEHGVVIGNEAVFTKVSREPEPGLIGMDLLRLALERAESAHDAVTVITELLERYGQGGNCGHTHEFTYDNGFLIADRHEAWILETAGREWAARRVDGADSISNAITTHSSFDRASTGLVTQAVRSGWCADPEGFDFAAAYSDRVYTRFSDARPRQCRTRDTLAGGRGRLDVPAMWALLGDHGVRAGGRERWSPADHPMAGLLGATVCMHAGLGPVRGSQTTGSWISELDPTGIRPDTHWVTGTAAPCLSLRWPLWFDALEAEGVPDTGVAPRGTATPGSLWWEHEDLHRSVLRDYARLRGVLAADRDGVQAQIDALAGAAVTGSVEDRAKTSAEAAALVREAISRWKAEIAVEPTPRSRRVGRRVHAEAWRRFDRAAGRV